LNDDDRIEIRYCGQLSIQEAKSSSAMNLNSAMCATASAITSQCTTSSQKH